MGMTEFLYFTPDSRPILSLSQYISPGGNILTMDNSISVSFLILDYDLNLIKYRKTYRF